MEDVPRATQLSRRKGVYYFRARVSSEIAKLLSAKVTASVKQTRARVRRPAWTALLGRNGEPRKELLVSLRTSKLSEARERLLKEQIKLQELYRMVQAEFGIAPAQALRQATAQDIDGIAQRYFASLENPPLSNKAAEVRASSTEVEEDLVSGLVYFSSDDESVIYGYRKQAADLLKADNLSPENTSAVDRLAKYLRRADMEHSRRSLDRLNHDYSSHHDKLFPARPTSEVHDHQVTGSDRGVALSALIAAFQEKRLKNIKEKSLQKYQFFFGVLSEVIGSEKGVKSITRLDCRRVAEVLEKLPPNYTKNTKLRRMGVVKAASYAAANSIRPLSVKTLSDYLSKFSRLLQWAVDEDIVDKNLARSLVALAKDGAAEDKRRAFDDAALCMIFGANALLGLGESKFWAPVIGLFSGLRLSEILQLYVADIKQDGEVIYFDINVEDEEGGKARDKSLKRSSSRRKVPVHCELVALGFLDYVQTIRSRNEQRLFPDAVMGQDGTYSSPYSKWFSRRLKAFGIKKDRKLSFHSFRHTFRDGMRRSGLPSEVVDALGGWAPSKTSDIYGSGLSPRELKPMIDSVIYPGLDLTHLKKNR
ncbi:tyrosine-type recombinase/integrase [Aestuariivirga sp.]|uniref:tyrosine-type recombinase/integrase n=1 Tax=Aestuariivirga sp. TaxID=2650926 RepID=UPI0039E47603